jgi:hypothetical protein
MSDAAHGDFLAKVLGVPVAETSRTSSLEPETSPTEAEIDEGLQVAERIVYRQDRAHGEYLRDVLLGETGGG